MQNKRNPSYQDSNLDLIWSGLLDSNQRPRAPQTCALPTALNPDPECIFFGNAVQRYTQSLKTANFSQIIFSLETFAYLICTSI